jgi:hypothetical protein
MQQMQEQFGQLHVDQHYDIHSPQTGHFEHQPRATIITISPEFYQSNGNSHGLPTYAGYMLTRAEDPQGLPLSWSRIVKVPLSASQELLAAKAKEQATGRSSALKKLMTDRDMAGNKRKQIEGLISTENREEADDRFEWKLAYIDSTKKTKQSGGKKGLVRETVSIEVVLKRVPKPTEFAARPLGIHQGHPQPMRMGHAGPHLGPPLPGPLGYGPPNHGPPNHEHHQHGPPPPPPPPSHIPPHVQLPYAPQPPGHPLQGYPEDAPHIVEEFEEDIIWDPTNAPPKKDKKKKKRKEVDKGAPKGRGEHIHHLPSSPRVKRKDNYDGWSDYSEDKYSAGSDSEDFDYDNKTVIAPDDHNSSASSRAPGHDRSRDRHRRASESNRGMRSSHRQHPRRLSSPVYILREPRPRELDEEYVMVPKKNIVDGIIREAAASVFLQGSRWEPDRPPIGHAYSYDDNERDRGLRRDSSIGLSRPALTHAYTYDNIDRDRDLRRDSSIGRPGPALSRAYTYDNMERDRELRRDSGIGITRRSSEVVPRRVEYKYLDDMSRGRDRDFDRDRERDLNRERERSLEMRDREFNLERREREYRERELREREGRDRDARFFEGRRGFDGYRMA